MENKCSANVGQYLGLAACINLKIPEMSGKDDLSSSISILCSLGQSELSLYLEKTDPKLTEFILKTDYESKSGTTLFSVLIDTPGSSTNRKINVKGNLKFTGNADKSSRNRKLDITVENPWTNLHITGIFYFWFWFKTNLAHNKLKSKYSRAN